MLSTISTAPGDYNRDGIVDLLDRDVWQRFNGSTFDARADGSNDGIVDQADLEIWQAAVPEPSSHIIGKSVVNVVSGSCPAKGTFKKGPATLALRSDRIQLEGTTLL